MSTSAKTLIAAPVIYNELKDAEEKAIAVLGLLEDVIQPAFGDLRCDGLLDQKGKSRGDCAIDWVEKNFNALYSACYAARSLIEDVADTLQMLPVQQETEIGKEAAQRRQRAERARLEREREAQIEALRQIRDDPQATPGERLEAVKLLLELE